MEKTNLQIANEAAEKSLKKHSKKLQKMGISVQHRGMTMGSGDKALFQMLNANSSDVEIMEFLNTLQYKEAILAQPNTFSYTSGAHKYQVDVEVSAVAPEDEKLLHSLFKETST